eukprot:TRINITY_DN988_c0_g1_i3.p2 TRINITY_DN988_c0_g1~~TRINITY_DN988_c0_g1_i3.p2  ORF type:complete len:350 (+),score=119.01 TRINITY_DN988_c0_g1_i3:44-1093(+)
MEFEHEEMARARALACGLHPRCGTRSSLRALADFAWIAAHCFALQSPARITVAAFRVLDDATVRAAAAHGGSGDDQAAAPMMAALKQARTLLEDALALYPRFGAALVAYRCLQMHKPRVAIEAALAACPQTSAGSGAGGGRKNVPPGVRRSVRKTVRNSSEEDHAFSLHFLDWVAPDCVPATPVSAAAAEERCNTYALAVHAIFLNFFYTDDAELCARCVRLFERAVNAPKWYHGALVSVMNPWAANTYGVCMTHGEQKAGITADAARAVLLFTTARDRYGHVACAYNVAYNYYKGIGVGRDLRKSLAQFEHAEKERFYPAAAGAQSVRAMIHVEEKRGKEDDSDDGTV